MGWRARRPLWNSDGISADSAFANEAAISFANQGAERRHDAIRRAFLLPLCYWFCHRARGFNETLRQRAQCSILESDDADRLTCCGKLNRQHLDRWMCVWESHDPGGHDREKTS